MVIPRVGALIMHHSIKFLQCHTIVENTVSQKQTQELGYIIRKKTLLGACVKVSIYNKVRCKQDHCIMIVYTSRISEYCHCSCWYMWCPLITLHRKRASSAAACHFIPIMISRPYTTVPLCINTDKQWWPLFAIQLSAIGRGPTSVQHLVEIIGLRCESLTLTLHA